MGFSGQHAMYWAKKAPTGKSRPAHQERPLGEKDKTAGKRQNEWCTPDMITSWFDVDDGLIVLIAVTAPLPLACWYAPLT